MFQRTGKVRGGGAELTQIQIQPSIEKNRIRNALKTNPVLNLKTFWFINIVITVRFKRYFDQIKWILKKILFFSGLATKAQPPPHVELSCHIFFGIFLSSVKKSYFFLVARTLTSPPLLTGRASKKKNFLRLKKKNPDPIKIADLQPWLLGFSFFIWYCVQLARFVAILFFDYYPEQVGERNVVVIA